MISIRFSGFFFDSDENDLLSFPVRYPFPLVSPSLPQISSVDPTITLSCISIPFSKNNPSISFYSNDIFRNDLLSFPGSVFRFLRFPRLLQSAVSRLLPRRSVPLFAFSFVSCVQYNNNNKQLCTALFWPRRSLDCLITILRCLTQTPSQFLWCPWCRTYTRSPRIA